MEKLLPERIKPSRVKLCPSLDLVAVATDKTLEAFRFDGHVAFSVSRSSPEISIDSLAWLANGSGISIAWSDGTIDIVDSASGKLGRGIGGRDAPRSSPLSTEQQDGAGARIVSHAWALNLIEPDLVTKKSSFTQRSALIVSDHATRPSTNPHVPDESKTSTLEDLFERIPNEALIHAVADLPRQLALIKPDDGLPRLNFLPYIEDAALLSLSREAFATQTAINQLLYCPSKEDIFNNVCDVMLACWDDGVKSTACGELVCTNGSGSTAPDAIDMITGQASNPFSSCHAVVRRRTREHGTPLWVEIVALNGLNRSGQLFKLIIATTHTLKQLSDYVVHCIAAARATWRTSQSLPLRFVSNISEELAKRKHPETLEAALTHQAATGSPFPEVKEWLAEELQEQGYKRWDSAVTNGYTQLIELVHTQLLPALDYAALASARLRGISRREPPDPLFDVQFRYMTRILSDLDHLRLISHRLLEYATRELQLFRVFSNWLQLQIAIIRAEPSSTAANDAAEKTAGLDHGCILDYIKGPLLKSHLNSILGRPTQEVLEASRRPANQLKRWVLLKVLDKHEKEDIQPKPRSEGGTVEAVNILWQALMLRASIDEVIGAPRDGLFRQTETTGAVILDEHALTLQTSPGVNIGDLRMVVEEPDQGMMCTYVVDAMANPPAARIHRLLHGRRLQDLERSDTGTNRHTLNPGSLEIIMPTQDTITSLIATRLLTDDVLVALVTSNYTGSQHLELHWALYCTVADMSAGVKEWQPDWRMAKRWNVEQAGDFRPGVGCVEVRLATVKKNEAAHKGKAQDYGGLRARVLICILSEDGSRYRLEEADLV